MGTALGHQGVDLTVSVSLPSGVTAQNHLQYHVVAAPPAAVSPDECAAAFNSDIVTAYRNCMAGAAAVLAISWSTNTPAGIPPFPENTEFFSGQWGNRTGGIMPPYVSATILKIPDVAEQDPPDAYSNWRVGAVRIPGISESDQDAGLITASALIDALNALGEVLELGAVGGEELKLHFGRAGNATSPTPAIVPVLETVASTRLGSQNSRKISL